MTPKYHKCPIKFRFICCNSRGIPKSFNVKFQDFLKRIYGFLKLMNTSYFWCSDNSMKVLNNLKVALRILYACKFKNLSPNIG